MWCSNFVLHFRTMSWIFIFVRIQQLRNANWRRSVPFLLIKFGLQTRYIMPCIVCCLHGRTAERRIETFFLCIYLSGSTFPANKYIRHTLSYRCSVLDLFLVHHVKLKRNQKNARLQNVLQLYSLSLLCITIAFKMHFVWSKNKRCPFAFQVTGQLGCECLV